MCCAASISTKWTRTRSPVFDRLFGKAKPLAKIVQQYELVRNQIDQISNALERHKTQLLTDITTLDRLYDANLDYFHTGTVQAGEDDCRRWTRRNLPALEREGSRQRRTWFRLSAYATYAPPPATIWSSGSRPQTDRLKSPCRVCPASDWCRRTTKPDWRRRKNQSTLVGAVPLWRQQLAQAITILPLGGPQNRQATSDLTNELLEANADNLRQTLNSCRDRARRVRHQR